MKINRMPILATFFALAASLNTAQATLLSTDDAILGAGVITTDTNTGLEWLDLSVTLGLSWNEAEAIYAEYGFTHATTTQIEELFINADITTIDTGTSPDSYDQAKALQDLTSCFAGATYYPDGSFSSTCTTKGMTALDSLGRSEFSWITRDDTLGVSTTIVNSNNFIGSSGPEALDSYSHPTIGHWLVRNIPVPAPSSVMLMVGGLILLTWMKSATNSHKKLTH